MPVPSLRLQLLYLILLSLALLSAQQVFGQSISVRAKVLQVSYNYPDTNDAAGGPDVQWSFSGRVTFNDFTRQLTWGSVYKDDRPNSSGTYSVDHTLYDNTVYLPEFQFLDLDLFKTRLKDLDLSENIKFELDYAGREKDGFANPDDYVENGSGTFTITDHDPGKWHEKTFSIRADNRQMYTFKMAFSYDIYDAITSINFKGEDDVSLTSLCQGSVVTMEAERSNHVKGGRFRFERKPDGAGTWEVVSEGSSNSIKVSSDDLAEYDYRVSMGSSGGYLGSENAPFNLPEWRIPRFQRAFTKANPFQATIEGACTGSSNGSITYQGNRTLPEGSRVRLSLVHNGVQQGSFNTLARNSYTYSNLSISRKSKGDTLFVTVLGPGAGCTSYLAFDVPEKKKPIISWVNVDSPTCGQANAGTIDVGADLNDNERVNFLLKDRDNNIVASSGLIADDSWTFTNQPPGNYRVGLVGENGCASRDFENVIITATPPAAEGTVRVINGGSNYDIACAGGEVQVRLSQPTSHGAYSVKVLPNGPTYYPGENKREFHTINAAGTYNFRFTRDSSGCFTDRAITITEEPNPVQLRITDAVDPTACNPGSGSFRVRVSNGIPPFTFRVNDEVVATSQANAFIIDNRNAREHTVIVTDNRGCTATRRVNLVETEGPRLTARITPPTCNGSNDGEIELTALGASTGPYTYKIAELDNTFGDIALFPSLSPGTYNASVKDGNDCIAELPITIPETPEVRFLGKSMAPIVCSGDTTEVKITLLGPTTCENGVRHAFDYSLDGGTTFQAVTSEISEAFECTGRFTFTINVPAGDYNLQFRNSRGCLSNITTIGAADFAEPPPLTLSLDTITDVSCYGGSDGSIRLNINGGRGAYRIGIWDAFDDGAIKYVEAVAADEPQQIVFDNLPVAKFSQPDGGHNFMIEDNWRSTDNGIRPCNIAFNLMGEGAPKIQQPPALEIGEMIQGPPVVCDFSNAELNLANVRGGTPPYQYRLFEEAFGDSPVLYPESDNYIRVHVRDSLGCSVSQAPSYVRDDNQPELTIGVIRPPFDCAGGMLSVTPSAGEPPYTIELQDGSERLIDTSSSNGEAITFDGLEAGAYVVRLKDKFSCSKSLSYSFEAGEALGVTTVGKTPESCKNSDDGSIAIRVSGGLPPYSIVYRGVASNGAERVQDSLSEGVHEFIIIDSLGCSMVYTDSVELNAFIRLATTSTGGGPCSYSETASVTVSPSGGQAPYQLEWLDDEQFNAEIAAGASTTRANMASTEYRVRVTDANGCQQEQDIYVEGVAEIELILDGNLQANCVEDISFNGEVNGGTAPYGVNISHNGGPFVPLVDSNQLRALLPGSYLLEVVDANGCKQPRPDTIIILPPDTQLTIIPTIDTVACSGTANGVLSVNLNHSSQDITYSLNGGTPQLDPVFNGLQGGSYSLTVNTLNCSGTVENIMMPESPPLLLEKRNVQSDQCAGEFKYLVTATGGTSPYTFVGAEQGNELALPFATYEVEAGSQREIMVVDATGCEATLSLVGPQFTDLRITGSDVQDYICAAGDTLRGAITVSGGQAPYSFAWSDGSTDSTLVTTLPGEYQVTITDGGGCLVYKVLSVGMTDPPLKIVDIIKAPPSCDSVPNGVVQFNLEGGSGNYEVRLFDLTQGTEHQQVEPGVVINLFPGYYQYEITDFDTDCVLTGRFGLSTDNGPELSLRVISYPSCNTPGNVEVLPAENEELDFALWSNGEQAISTLLPAGDHFVVGLAPNGCSTWLPISLESRQPKLVLDTFISPSCSSLGTLAVAVENSQANGSLQWNTGATTATINNLASGNYAVTYSDASGCTDVFNFSLEDAPALTVNITAEVPVGCLPGSLASTTVMASGGRAPYSYVWSNGDLGPTASNLSAGAYTVTVTDNSGCSTTLVTNARANVPPTIATMLSEPDDCSAEGIGTALCLALNGTAPLTYTWSNGDSGPEIEELSAGTYSVTVTDALGCTDTASVVIGQPVRPEVTLLPQNGIGCGTNNISLTRVMAMGAVAPYHYAWSNGAFGATVLNLPQGENTVTVTDSLGCITSLSVEVTEQTLDQRSAPDVSLEELSEESCLGAADGEISVTTTGTADSLTFRWSNGATTPTISNLTGGQTYTVTVTNSYGCFTSLPVTLAEGQPLNLADLPTDASVCQGNIFPLDLSAYPGAAVTGPNGFSSSAPTAYLEEAGLYTINYVDPEGCTGSGALQLGVSGLGHTARALLASDIVLADTLLAVEVSVPIPDSVAWIFDTDRVQLVQEEDNRYYLQFSEVGTYDLQLVSSLGGCTDLISKRVTVHQDSTSIPNDAQAPLIIQTLSVTTDESQGQFNVVANLTDTTSIFLSLFRETGELIEQRRIDEENIIFQTYDLPSDPGRYYLKAWAGEEQRIVAIQVE